MNNTTENNKLIAEFMGYFYVGYSPIWRHKDTDEILEELLYHKSWDWVIPVIQEIGNRTEYELVIGAEYSYWNKYGDTVMDGKEFRGYNSIEHIHEAVIEFIKWYNENNG